MDRNPDDSPMRLFAIGAQPKEVTIRIWRGCRVLGLFFVGPTGSGMHGAASPLDTSTAVDIELDPWAGRITVNGYPTAPVDIVERIDEEPPF